MDVQQLIVKVKPLFLQGQFKLVEETLKQGIETFGAQTELLIWLCNFYNHMRRFEDLVALFTVETVPQPCALIYIQACRALKHHEQAKAVLTRQTALSSEQKLLLAIIDKEMGNSQEAKFRLTELIANQPDYTEAYWQLTILGEKLTEEFICKLKALIESSTLPADRHAYACYALASTLDKQGNYQDAFNYYQQGAQAKLTTFRHYKPSEELAELDKLRDAFSCHKASDKQFVASSTPIFIVGMPRSGTTLVEQILASHSDVTGADELYDLAFATQTVLQRVKPATPYPYWSNELSEFDYAEIAENYLLLTKAFQKTPFFTDKMPLNFKAIGIIMRSFPNAKIVHCKRGKLDTIWGNFKQLFGEGLTFSYNLQQLFSYYDKYESLMEHWINLYGNNIYTVEYEKLVDNFESESKQLLDFIGLEMQDACLTFYNSERVIHTLSNQQVRQPLFREGIDRWKNYEFALAPFMQSK